MKSFQVKIIPSYLSVDVLKEFPISIISIGHGLQNYALEIKKALISLLLLLLDIDLIKHDNHFLMFHKIKVMLKLFHIIFVLIFL